MCHGWCDTHSRWWCTRSSPLTICWPGFQSAATCRSCCSCNAHGMWDVSHCVIFGTLGKTLSACDVKRATTEEFSHALSQNYFTCMLGGFHCGHLLWSRRCQCAHLQAPASAAPSPRMQDRCYCAESESTERRSASADSAQPHQTTATMIRQDVRGQLGGGSRAHLGWCLCTLNSK